MNGLALNPGSSLKKIHQGYEPDLKEVIPCGGSADIETKHSLEMYTVQRRGDLSGQDNVLVAGEHFKSADPMTPLDL